MDRVQYCKGGEEMNNFKSVVALEIIKLMQKERPKATLEEVDSIIKAFEAGFDAAMITNESDQKIFLAMLRASK
jgi:hypothetical protein